MFRQYWSRSMNKLSEVSVFELNATTNGKNWVEKKKKRTVGSKKKKEENRVTTRATPFAQIILTGPEIRFDPTRYFFCLPSRMPTVYLTLAEKCTRRAPNFPICVGAAGLPFNSLHGARHCRILSRRSLVVQNYRRLYDPYNDQPCIVILLFLQRIPG